MFTQENNQRLEGLVLSNDFKEREGDRKEGRGEIECVCVCVWPLACWVYMNWEEESCCQRDFFSFSQKKHVDGCKLRQAEGQTEGQTGVRQKRKKVDQWLAGQPYRRRGAGSTPSHSSEPQSLLSVSTNTTQVS